MLYEDHFLTSKADVESHFFNLLVTGSGRGRGILEADPGPGETTAPGLTMLRLGLGPTGGRGLVPVNKSPGGEDPSLFMPGLGAGGRHGVDLPEDGRDWSLLTGILLGTAGNCLPDLLLTLILLLSLLMSVFSCPSMLSILLLLTTSLTSPSL